MIDTQAIRKKILDLALRGKLTEQLPEDGTAEELFQKIQEEKQALTDRGIISVEKPLPEISQNELPFAIPNNWKWIRHNSIFDISGGSQPAKNNFVDQPQQGYIQLYQIRDYGDKPQPVYIPISMAMKTTKAGDILLARYGGSLGKVFWAKDGAYNVAMAKIIYLFNQGSINAHYLYYYYHGPIYRNFIQSISRSAQSGFNREDLKSLLFPLPPLAEQNRIVEKIESIFPILDTIDTLQSQYQDNLAALKSKIIDAGIQGKLTEQFPEDGTAEELYQQIQQEKLALEKAGKIKKSKPLPPISDEEKPFDIPENWKWVRLEEVTKKITSGNTPPGGKKSDVYVDKGFCFFREQNIYNDGIHHAGMVYISEQLLNTRENSTVIAKDILLNITGGSIGRCAIVPDDFTRGSINQHILIIRMVNEVMRFYIHSVMCSDYAQQYIKKKAVGDKDGFSGGRCKSMPIPLPPLAEQKRIVAKLEELLPLCE